MTDKKAETIDVKLPFSVPTTNYFIDYLTKENMDEALSVLVKSWMDMEPQVIWLKQTPKEILEFSLSSVKKELEEGRSLSLVITDKNGRIVGTMINKEFDFDEASDPQNPIDMMMDELHQKYKEYYRANHKEGKIMEALAGGVLEEVRGCGIAATMAAISMILAHKLGYTWGIAETSSILSSAGCDRGGYTKVYALNQEEYSYVDKSGETKKPFAGMDAWFTGILNTKRPKHKQLTTSAAWFTCYECNLVTGHDMLGAIISMFSKPQVSKSS